MVVLPGGVDGHGQVPHPAVLPAGKERGASVSFTKPPTRPTHALLMTHLDRPCRAQVGAKALAQYDTLPGVKEFRRKRQSFVPSRRERRSLDNAIRGVTATEDE